MKKKKKYSKLFKNIISINAFVQLGLFIGTILYISSVASVSVLLSLQGVLIGGLWLLAVAPISIVISAMAGYQEYMQKQSKQTSELISTPLPTLGYFMKRSLLAWVIYVAGFLVILWLTFGIMDVFIDITRLLIPDISAFVSLIVSFAILPVFLFGFFSAIFFVNVPQPLLDFYLYPNQSIQQIVYKDGINPLAWHRLKPNLLLSMDWLFRLSTFMMLVAFVQFLPDILSEGNVDALWMLPIGIFLFYIALKLTQRFVFLPLSEENMNNKTEIQLKSSCHDFKELK